jgi:hypothetical protein
MKPQNSIEIMKQSESYTFVSPLTLKMIVVPSSEPILREPLSEPLHRRAPEEIAELRRHPFFATR